MAPFSMKSIKSHISSSIPDNPFTIDNAKNLADAAAYVAKKLADDAPYVAKKLADDAPYVAKKLALSTGKAAWYTCTNLLILGIPLLFLQDREFCIQLQKEEARSLGLTSQDIINAYGY